MRQIHALITLLFASAVAVLLPKVAGASVSLSFGAGSAVTNIDRQATFDSLHGDGIPLSSYAEDLLSIVEPASSYVGFQPFNGGPLEQFYYGAGSNSSYVTITPTDSATFAGLELMIGDGYTTATTLFAWETFLDGALTGSGNSITAPKGSVVGWNDPNGFDELLIGAGNPSSMSYHLGDDGQAIAIDNVNVQLWKGASGTVPEPVSIAVWCGLMAIGWVLTYCRLVSHGRN